MRVANQHDIVPAIDTVQRQVLDGIALADSENAAIVVLTPGIRYAPCLVSKVGQVDGVADTEIGNRKSAPRRLVELQRAGAVAVAVSERYIHGPVAAKRVGKVRDAVVGDENADRTGFRRSVHSRITTDENPTASGPQRAASNVGMVEVDCRATANGRDCTIVEKPTIGGAGDVLENDGAAIPGVDYAAGFVRDRDIVERDNSAALGFDCAQIVDLAAAVKTAELDPSAVFGLERALRPIGNACRTAFDTVEFNEPVIVRVDQAMVRNPTAGELDEGVVSYDRCAGFIGDDFTVERDDAVMLGGDVAGIAEMPFENSMRVSQPRLRSRRPRDWSHRH